MTKQTLKIALVLVSVIFGLVFSSAVFAQTADRVVLADGTIYLASDTEKRAFPSADVYFSHGYEFSNAVAASSADTALPDGAVMSYREGSLVKGDSATVYIISNETKRPFTSGEAFLGLGYSFANVLSDSAGLLGNLADGLPVDSANDGHPAGTLINDSGTVYLLTQSGKRGIPSLSVFDFHRYNFSNVVLANSADRVLEKEELLTGGEVADEPAPPQTGNANPTKPTITGPALVEIGVEQTYSFVSDDTDGGNLSYTVDWADGSIDTATEAAGQNVSLIHTWSTLGSFDVTVTVDDGSGGVASNTLSVEAQAASEFAHAPSAPTKEGVIAAFPQTGNDFSFVSTDVDGDNIAYTVDWGDGSSSSGTKASGVKFTIDHSWRFIGDYTITVTADDGTEKTSSSTFAMKVGADPTEFGPAVTVLSPNGGEVFDLNSSAKITWKRNWIPLNSQKNVSVLYRRGGVNVTIESGVKTDSYTWITQGAGIMAADNYKIVVLAGGSANTGVFLSDTSDGEFSLK